VVLARTYTHDIRQPYGQIRLPIGIISPHDHGPITQNCDAKVTTGGDRFDARKTRRYIGLSEAIISPGDYFPVAEQSKAVQISCRYGCHIG
jgi:hypothetical protein